jgi:hypothetical protein
MLRIGDRDPPVDRIAQILHARRLQRAIGACPDGDAPLCVDLHRIGDHQTLVIQCFDERLVCRVEEVERCAAFDLLRQLTGRTKVEHNLDTGLLLEEHADLIERWRQIGGSGNDQFSITRSA